MHTIHLTRTLYIEKEDFRFEDSADYYGLAPGKTAGLRYAGFVKVAQVVKDEAGNVSGEKLATCAMRCIFMRDLPAAPTPTSFRLSHHCSFRPLPS